MFSAVNIDPTGSDTGSAFWLRLADTLHSSVTRAVVPASLSGLNASIAI
jgi:hypothetical protein